MPRTKKHMFTKKYIDGKFKNIIYDRCVISLTREKCIIANNKLSLDNTTKEDGKISEKNNMTIDVEPIKKKQKLDTNEIDIFKSEVRKRETHQFKSKVKSSLKPNEEIVSTCTEKVSMVTDCAESTESANSSAENVRPKIWVIDYRKIIDERKYKPVINYEVSELSTSGIKESLRNDEENGVKQPLNGKNHVKWNLIEIEKLHEKYFGKFVQVTIVTIANILNVISISNEHLKARLDESTKKISEAEKIKDICDARRLHERYNKILEIKLKNKFMNVTSSFEESEFDSAFIMFFLSILTVLRVLDHPKFGNCQELFETVKKLLPESLINNEYNYPKFFSMFRSTTFYSDCTNILSVINYSRDTDPGVTDRMPLFFLKTSNSLVYFKAVINAVTGDSNEDLSLLIENATFNCYYNSEVVEPVVSSTVQHSNYNTPTIETIQSPINSDETINNWNLAKNQNGTKPAERRTIIIDNRQYQLVKDLSGQLRAVFMPTLSNSPLIQVTVLSSETSASTPITTTCRSVDGPSDQMQALKNSTSVPDKSPPTIIIKCDEGHCNDSAIITCKCRKANYCSNSCRTRHWYVHYADCEERMTIP